MSQPREIASSIVCVYATFRISRWIARRAFVARPFEGIPGPKSSSWIGGNLRDLFNANGLPFHQHISDTYGGMARVYGFFGDEQLFISDPHAIQAILGKDQDSFDETEVFLETNKIIFGPGLVATSGDVHRRQRKLASPLFSTGQLSKVVPTFYEVAEKLVNVLEREFKASKGDHAVLDMSEWTCRASLEAAGRAILGYSFDPLDSPVSNPYTAAIKELIPAIFSLALIRNFAPFLAKLGPAWLRRWIVERIPSRRVQRVRMSSDVMHESAKKILDERLAQHTADESAPHPEQPKDVITMLLAENEKVAPEDRMSENELTGQMTVLIFGAQDTTSSAMSRILHTLAAYPEIQEKVRDELREAHREHHTLVGDDPQSNLLDQNTIMNLPWLDAVVKETLRLYPPVAFVRRVCTETTSLRYTPHPDHTSSSTSSKDGELSTIVVPKGTTLFVSILGYNRLESVWGPDAKEWNPRRWMASPEQTASETKRLSDSYSVKMPGSFNNMLSFLGGRRACIGTRFAILEMKIILATILSRFKFSQTDDRIVWNLSQIIAPSVRRVVSGKDGAPVEEESKGLPLYADLDDLTVPS